MSGFLVAFATYAEAATLTRDDRAAADALRARGVRVEPAVWDDTAVDWQRFDAVVVRSCWNYHLRPRAFRGWIDRLDALGVALFNPPDVVRWNIDKRYLFDLQAAGVAIPPTVLLEPDAAPTAVLTDMLAQQGWERAVVKPTFSGTAYNTFLTDATAAAADQSRLDGMLRESAVLVQQFQPAIQTAGEWSLIFFGETFSHAALKQPKNGDFRVQEEYGGRSVAAAVPDGLVTAVAGSLGPYLARCVYTRVDVVVVDGKPLLMELEQVEPFLFFGFRAESTAVFADTLLARLESARA